MKRRETQPVYTPSATYRLQFNKSFTFEDAAGLVDYLDELGITDIYASPFLMARPGSMHGYDVTDHRASIRRSAMRRLSCGFPRRCSGAGWA